MKNYILLLFFAIGISGYSQIKDLVAMADGELAFFEPIFEQDKSLYGYVAVYVLGAENKTERTYEYVILDTRLANVANGQFLVPYYKGTYSYFTSVEKIGKELLLSRMYSTGATNFWAVAFTSNIQINLESNEVTPTFYYDNGSFKDGYRVAKTIKKDQKRYDVLDVLFGIGDDYFSFQVEKQKNTLGGMRSAAVYGLDRNKKWDRTFKDPEDKKKKKNSYGLVYSDPETLIIQEKEKYNRTLEMIDPQTGETVFTYLVENRDSKYNHTYDLKRLGDEIVLTGKISKWSSFGYKFEEGRGVFKIVLDLQGNEIFKRYFLWEEASDFLEMNARGKLEKGYRLASRDYFIFKDGRVTFLAEKFKDSYNILMGENVPRATDFVVMEFTSEFELKNVEVIKKDKSRYSISDYLFSQEVNDGSGAIFFYRDYQKDAVSKKRNWVLGIVKLVSGTFDYEQIPMSSKEFYIDPYIAKEGYILLREYNKDKDHNQVRLERINY